MTPRDWWPFNDGEPVPAPPIDKAAIDLAVLEARVEQAELLIRDAVNSGTLLHHRDLLLDIRLALRPVKLRPAVPVVPGPGGA